MADSNLESRLSLLLDRSVSDEQRTEIFWLLDSEVGIPNDVLPQLLNDPSSYMRNTLATFLGKRRHRNSYDFLLALMRDKDFDIRITATISLGVLGDSRALFALSNYFVNAPVQIKEAVVLAVRKLQDPRSKSFLELIKNDDVVGDTVALALKHFSFKPNFQYAFAGSKDLYSKASFKRGRILIRDANSLNSSKTIFAEAQKDFHYVRPQTYVVSLDKRLFIGGLLNEHVNVAQGAPVLSAGEIIFTQSNNLNWSVAMLNNRSNGYFPSEESLVHVKNALKLAKIPFGDAEITIYPRDGYFTSDFLFDKPFFNFHQQP